MAEQTKLTVSRLVELAAEMRTPDLGVGATESVMRDIRLISDLYLARYEANYAATGQAFGNDEVWSSDSSVCAALLGG